VAVVGGLIWLSGRHGEESGAKRWSSLHDARLHYSSASAKKAGALPGGVRCSTAAAAAVGGYTIAGGWGSARSPAFEYAYTVSSARAARPTLPRHVLGGRPRRSCPLFSTSLPKASGSAWARSWAARTRFRTTIRRSPRRTSCAVPMRPRSAGHSRPGFAACSAPPGQHAASSGNHCSVDVRAPAQARRPRSFFWRAE